MPKHLTVLSSWQGQFLCLWLSTYCGLAKPCDEIWVNLDSGNDLLPDGTKPLPEPILSKHQMCHLASSVSNFTRSAHAFSPYHVFENYTFQIFTFPTGQWVNAAMKVSFSGYQWWRKLSVYQMTSFKMADEISRNLASLHKRPVVCEATWKHKNARSVCIFLVMLLQWRHNEPDGVSNYRRLDCLLNRLFSRRSKKTLNLRATGIFEGNPPPVTDGFSSQRARNAKMFPFDDVIMALLFFTHQYFNYRKATQQMQKGLTII